MWQKEVDYKALAKGLTYEQASAIVARAQARYVEARSVLTTPHDPKWIDETSSARMYLFIAIKVRDEVKARIEEGRV